MNDVKLLTPPPDPVTVTRKEPVGVEDCVLMVNVLEKGGNPLGGMKLHKALDGRPVQERLIPLADPLINVEVIVLDPEAPWMALSPPELLKLKLKVPVVGAAFADLFALILP